MGWLGWEPQVALGADVNLVIMALDERSDLISMIFGDGKKSGARKRKPTAADLKEFARQHNLRRKDFADG